MMVKICREWNKKSVSMVVGKWSKPGAKRRELSLVMPTIYFPLFPFLKIWGGGGKGQDNFNKWSLSLLSSICFKS